MKYAPITFNGKPLSLAESMTVHLALQAFVSASKQALKGSPTDRRLVVAYGRVADRLAREVEA